MNEHEEGGDGNRHQGARKLGGNNKEEKNRNNFLNKKCIKELKNTMHN
jgi:hypothetical protein